MSEALIRAQIKSILEGVTGIGVVHDYNRYPRSLADYLKLMTSSKKVNGWTISRQNTPSEKKTAGVGGKFERRHRFSISGIYELDDAAGSEKTFQGILDAIFDAFKANGDLNGTAQYHDQIQIESDTLSVEHEYGQDYYHIGECTLVVHELV